MCLLINESMLEYPQNFIDLWRKDGLRDSQIEIFVRQYQKLGCISKKEYNEIGQFLNIQENYNEKNKHK